MRRQLVGGSHVTFLRFKFHDVVATNGTIHNECLYSVGPHLTVKRSHSLGDAPYQGPLHYSGTTGPPQAAYGDVTIENNVFEHPRMEDGHGWHYYGLFFGGQFNFDGALLEDMKVRYNTFETAVSLNDTFRAAGSSEWIGNVGGGCARLHPGAWVSRYSTWGRQLLERPDVSALARLFMRASRVRDCPYRDPGLGQSCRHNFHLKRGARAIGLGHPDDFPAMSALESFKATTIKANRDGASGSALTRLLTPEVASRRGNRRQTVMPDHPHQDHQLMPCSNGQRSCWGAVPATWRGPRALSPQSSQQ